MQELTLQLTSMANGGSAMGRDESGRAVFVPFTIPGEQVRVRITSEKKSYAQGELLELLSPSLDRVEPQCPHFTVCGGCHFQHIAYEAQLKLKQEVVQDQLSRIGGFREANVMPTLANPTPWAYRHDISLSPTEEGGLGFWSPSVGKVIPIERCPIIHPQLSTLWQDLDMELPGLRKMTLRVGDDEALLAAMEIDDVEPPELEVDFPISVAIILPDRTAASLIGDNHLIQSVRGSDFRVSPGCFFQPSPAAAELLIDTLVRFAALSGAETVVELYSGVGMLTRFLAVGAAQLIGIEANADAIEDASVNLADFDNISLYQGWVEDVLPMLDAKPDLMVINPPDDGLSVEARKSVIEMAPARLIYVSSDAATVSRDGKQLARVGYQLKALQPIDMTPHNFQIDTISLWEKAP